MNNEIAQRLLKAAYLIYDEIGYDIHQLEDKELTSEGIVEICFDAGRLAQKDQALSTIWVDLVAKEGYDKCLKSVAKSFYFGENNG